VVDLCPVGALLSRSFLYKSRVWYLKATPSVCPRCARGCSVSLWHRKPEWALRALDPAKNVAIERVTPRDNPAVNGPWMCNIGRDLTALLERARALQPMRGGAPVTSAGVEEPGAARVRAPPAALVSSGARTRVAAFKARARVSRSGK
jgi:NADH-quinone oxidoreductase subunit G